MSIAHDSHPRNRRKYNHNAIVGNKLNLSIVRRNAFMI